MPRKRSARGEEFNEETATVLEQAYERAVVNRDTPIIDDLRIRNLVQGFDQE